MIRGEGDTLIKGHDDIGTEIVLGGNGFLGSHEDGFAGFFVGELDPLLGDGLMWEG